MSFNLQGINMLGIKDQVSAAQLNAIRSGLLNAVGIDNFKATNQGTSTPASQIKLTCDRARLWDPTGSTPALAKEVDCTIDLSTSGANGLDVGSMADGTWYYLWLIGKCEAGDARATDLAGLASLSATVPNMPTGYTHRRLVGVFRAGTGGAIQSFAQHAETWLYCERQLVMHRTSIIVRTTQSLTAFLPPESRIALIKMRAFAPASNGAADGGLWVKGVEDRISAFDADYAEESQTTLWLPAPTRELDYACTAIEGSSNSVDIWCLGFRWPINKEA